MGLIIARIYVQFNHFGAGISRRAIRYKGTDEAYAIHELYLKLQSEVQKQKTRIFTAGGASKASGRRITVPNLSTSAGTTAVGTTATGTGIPAMIGTAATPTGDRG